MLVVSICVISVTLTVVSSSSVKWNTLSDCFVDPVNARTSTVDSAAECILSCHVQLLSYAVFQDGKCWCHSSSPGSSNPRVSGAQCYQTLDNLLLSSSTSSLATHTLHGLPRHPVIWLPLTNSSRATNYGTDKTSICEEKLPVNYQTKDPFNRHNVMSMFGDSSSYTQQYINVNFTDVTTYSTLSNNGYVLSFWILSRRPGATRYILGGCHSGTTIPRLIKNSDSDSDLSYKYKTDRNTLTFNMPLDVWNHVIIEVPPSMNGGYEIINVNGTEATRSYSGSSAYKFGNPFGVGKSLCSINREVPNVSLYCFMFIPWTTDFTVNSTIYNSLKMACDF